MYNINVTLNVEKRRNVKWNNHEDLKLINSYKLSYENS